VGLLLIYFGLFMSATHAVTHSVNHINVKNMAAFLIGFRKRVIEQLSLIMGSIGRSVPRD